VDGRPWRVVPDEVVVRVGLATGVRLERALLRRLRAELAEARARELAGRALARRELSRCELERRLARARVEPRAGERAVEALERVGVLDDARVAFARAQALAERGYGDAAICARLAAAGIGEPEARAAVAILEPEDERARRLVSAERDLARAARTLARRGFDPGTVESILGPLD
jgi:regulatory protein